MSFVTGLIAGGLLLFLLSMGIFQYRVSRECPDYRVYWNPFGFLLLWAFTRWINSQYKAGMRVVSVPKLEWFPNARNLFVLGPYQAFQSIEARDSESPYFLGYKWYREYILYFDKGSCIFFTPWVYPMETKIPVFLFSGKAPHWRILWGYVWGVYSNREKDY